MEGYQSSVNLVLRNPYRVFNHLDLIEIKVAIGKKWNFTSNDDSSDEIHREVIKVFSSLQQRNTSVDEAVRTIASKNNRSVDELVQDMDSTYHTGQLEFHITDKCDLDCVDCHYAHKTGATVDFDKLPIILRGLSPRAITITGGGEPNVYESQGRTMNDVVLLIHEILPNAQIGLINNNTRMPEGTWTDHILWQRSSIDASTAETYRRIKRLDKYGAVVANVKHMLTDTLIQHVGIGFLYRSENSHEIFDFLVNWFEWYQQQSQEIQQRFNIQFRPIPPPIQQTGLIIAGADYLPKAIVGTVKQQVVKVLDRAEKDDDFANFLYTSTNFQSLVDKARERDPFVHSAKPFAHCYNALIHRVFRADGTEYPDFLLPAFPEFALGNTLQGNPEAERTRIGLLQYFFHEKMSRFCNPNSCRQSWVSHIIENPDPEQVKNRPINNYFF
jgi:hypothetical protein